MQIIFLLASLILLQNAPGAPPPIGRLELLALQLAGVRSKKLVESINHRGVNFAPDSNYLHALAMAGADAPEIRALKAARHLSSKNGTSAGDARAEAAGTMHLIRGIELNRNNFHLADAEPEFRAAVDADPRSPFTHVALGELLEQLHQEDAAGKEFKAALELDPDLAVAHAGLGDVMIGTGKYAAGAQEYRKAVKLDPHDPDLVYQVGLNLQMAGDKKQSHEEMQIAEKMGWTPPPPKRIRVGGQVMRGRRLHTVKPAYPVEAKARGIEGVVKLSILVGTDGAVKDLKVISGDPLLAQAAADAVRRWTFQPVTIVGRPIQVVTEVDVNFHLH